MCSRGRVTLILLAGYLLASVAAPLWHHHDHRSCNVLPVQGEPAGGDDERACDDNDAGCHSTFDNHAPSDRRQDRPVPLPRPDHDGCQVCRCLAQAALPVVAPMAEQLFAPVKSFITCPDPGESQASVSLPLSRAPPGNI